MLIFSYFMMSKNEFSIIGLTSSGNLSLYWCRCRCWCYSYCHLIPLFLHCRAIYRFICWCSFFPQRRLDSYKNWTFGIVIAKYQYHQLMECIQFHRQLIDSVASRNHIDISYASIVFFSSHFIHLHCIFRCLFVEYVSLISPSFSSSPSPVCSCVCMCHFHIFAAFVNFPRNTRKMKRKKDERWQTKANIALQAM